MTKYLYWTNKIIAWIGMLFIAVSACLSMALNVIAVQLAVLPIYAGLFLTIWYNSTDHRRLHKFVWRDLHREDKVKIVGEVLLSIVSIVIVVEMLKATFAG